VQRLGGSHNVQHNGTNTTVPRTSPPAQANQSQNAGGVRPGSAPAWGCAWARLQRRASVGVGQVAGRPVWQWPGKACVRCGAACVRGGNVGNPRQCGWGGQRLGRVTVEGGRRQEAGEGLNRTKVQGAACAGVPATLPIVGSVWQRCVAGTCVVGWAWWGGVQAHRQVRGRMSMWEACPTVQGSVGVWGRGGGRGGGGVGWGRGPLRYGAGMSGRKGRRPSQYIHAAG